MFHRIGTSPDGDVELFRQFTKDENASARDDLGTVRHRCLPTAAGWCSATGSTPKSNDVWLVDFDRFLATGVIERRPVVDRHDRRRDRDGDRRHALSADDEGRAQGRVVAASVDAPEAAALARHRPRAGRRGDRRRRRSARACSPSPRCATRQPAWKCSIYHGAPSRPGRRSRGSAPPRWPPRRIAPRPISRSPASTIRRRFSVSISRRRRRRRSYGSGPTCPSIRRRSRSSRSGTRRRTARRSACSSSTQGPVPQRRDADAAQRLRRLQHQRDAGVRADAVSVVRGRRPVRAAEPARRRRVRRRLARGRHARHASRTSSTTSSRRPSG